MKLAAQTFAANMDSSIIWWAYNLRGKSILDTFPFSSMLSMGSLPSISNAFLWLLLTNKFLVRRLSASREVFIFFETLELLFLTYSSTSKYVILLCDMILAWKNLYDFIEPSNEKFISLTKTFRISSGTKEHKLLEIFSGSIGITLDGK